MYLPTTTTTTTTPELTTAATVSRGSPNTSPHIELYRQYIGTDVNWRR